MGEDLGDHGGIYEGGDDRQGAAPLWAVFPVDSEHPDAAGPSGCGSAPREGARHRGQLRGH
jgi:hypothetical protein